MALAAGAQNADFSVTFLSEATGEQDPPGREPKVKPPRHWRTRKDPFEGVWCDVLEGLQEDPDASAMALLGRLQADHRTGSAGRTCARYSTGCSSGEALWQTSWSTPGRNLPRQAQVDCRKWRWRRAIQSAEFSVTFFGEATGMVNADQ